MSDSEGSGSEPGSPRSRGEAEEGEPEDVEDDEEDEEGYRDYNDDALDPNEAEEAGQTAADVEARMRQRDRLGQQEERLDEEAIENYYRNRYNEDTAAIARFGEGGEEMSD